VDFIAKLRRDPGRLEILGDGRQSKPYIHVDDVIDAVLLADRRGDADGRADVDIGAVTFRPADHIGHPRHHLVVPLARESQRLPEIELVYFNDVSGEYESSTTEAIALEIRESQLSVSTPSEEPAPAEVEVPGSDSDSKVNIRTLLLWLALALGVSLLIWLVALALLKRRKR